MGWDLGSTPWVAKYTVEKKNKKKPKHYHHIQSTTQIILQSHAQPPLLQEVVQVQEYKTDSYYMQLHV